MSIHLNEPCCSRVIHQMEFKFTIPNVRKIKNKWASSLLPSNSLGEQFANDFLQQQAKNTVAPATFNMQALSLQLPKQSSSSSLATNWANEYNVASRPVNPLAAQWSSQYNQARPSMENAWAAATGQQLPYAAQGTSSQNYGSSSTDPSMWSSEFLDNFDTNTQKMKDSSAKLGSMWAEEYTNDNAMDTAWDAIQKNVEWAQGDSMHSQATNDKYEHQEQNSFLNHEDPMTEGDSLMNNGDLGAAMLAYEAAVQKNPQDAKAWCRLGLAHAENEQDIKAIVAFNNCIKIEPNNQEALLALSVSLANESMENDALRQLERWIAVYEGTNAIEIHRTPSTSSFLDLNAFKMVEDRYLAAARKQQQATPDSSLQNALGVLYNLNRNFERAVDCLQLAIASRPDDARLWNRLGATLANGDRTEEAIGAYREAIRRYPTYVRARYNLGISCMHLNSYREATEHFVSALDLQKSEGHSIWPTLRSSTIRMRGCNMDLMGALDRRDLATFKQILGGIPVPHEN